MTPSVFPKEAIVKIAEHWALGVREGVLSAPFSGNPIVLPARRPAVVALLQSLTIRGQTVAQLELELKKMDRLGLPELRDNIEFLQRHLMLARELRVGDEPIGLLEPLSTDFNFEEKSLPSDKKVVFSRFALLRREGGHWLLESPLLFCRLQIIDPDVLALLPVFSKPQSVAQALEQAPMPPEKTRRLLALLYSMGFIEPCAVNDEKPPSEAGALQLWEFHDLYFHTRTRIGRHRNPVGHAPRFKGILPPPPPFKEHKNKAVIYLPKADMAFLKENEISLTEAMELRKSERRHGHALISLTEVGEFLFRVARIKSFFTKGDYVVSQRPYPNAGASYEIELYLLVQACENLPPGLYHYEPVEHGLVQVQQPSDATEALFAAMNYSNKEDFAPQIILILTARFARNSWKYQTLSYVNTLKNVGVLFQSMYLVATAMGLSANGWSAGNSDLFNKVAGVNYYEETSVGEFLLGAPSGEESKQ